MYCYEFKLFVKIRTDKSKGHVQLQDLRIYIICLEYMTMILAQISQFLIRNK